mgnify:CR=1 FL=1
MDLSYIKKIIRLLAKEIEILDIDLAGEVRFGDHFGRAFGMGEHGEVRGGFGHGTAPGIFHTMWQKNRFIKYFGVIGIFGPLVILIYYMYIESWTLAYSFFAVTVGGVSYPRNGMTDTMVLFFCAAAIYCYLLGRRHPGAYCGLWVSVALALMTTRTPQDILVALTLHLREGFAVPHRPASQAPTPSWGPR